MPFLSQVQVVPRPDRFLLIRLVGKTFTVITNVIIVIVAPPLIVVEPPMPGPFRLQDVPLSLSETVVLLLLMAVDLLLRKPILVVGPTATGVLVLQLSPLSLTPTMGFLMWILATTDPRRRRKMFAFLWTTMTNMKYTEIHVVSISRRWRNLQGK
jgi:hypothetical protein